MRPYFDLCHRVFYLFFPLRVLQFLILHVGLKSILSLSLCMVLGSVLISFFYMQLSSFPSSILLKRLSLLHSLFLPLLSKIRYPQMHGFISGLSILFHWSIFLFLCQHDVILMTVTLQDSLKSGRLIPPAPFFFLKIAFAIWGLLCFHTNCEIFLFQFCEKCHQVI